MEGGKRKSPNKKVLTREEGEGGEENSEEHKKKLKATQQQEQGGPTEEEVEEFYAILRRMKVAVKYFDDKGMPAREWREALHQPEHTAPHGADAVAGGVADGAKKEDEVIVNGGFDLNAVAPEAAEIGGA